MTWTCAKCGTEATANSSRVFVRIGWRTNYPEGPLCPPCAKQITQEAKEA